MSRVGRRLSVPRQAVQQPLHPLQPQGRAEETGKGQPPGGEGGGVRRSDLAPLQVLLHQPLVQGGQILLERGQAGGKIQAAAVKLALELGQEGLPVAACQIHLVDKEEGGDAVPRQQLPQGAGVALDAVGSWMSVSRKASRWSTRPSFRTAPPRYSIPSDRVVFPASTWANIPKTSFFIRRPPLIAFCLRIHGLRSLCQGKILFWTGQAPRKRI